MRFGTLLAGALALSTVSADNSTYVLNGWYACNALTFSNQGSRSETSAAECAIYNAPLCYSGICVDEGNRTIEVFVKRIMATSGDADSAPNVWFLQGGPGASSSAMETAMTSLYTLLAGAVNVYTMDHRGTGRSNLLDCVASQTTTSGSPGGSSITMSEVPNCAQELETKYGSDLSSFSITSAATDMSTFISAFHAGKETYVYGVSYGTSVVERLMHLAPKEVVGYILDGVSTASGSDPSKLLYMSKWDSEHGEVATVYMDLCRSDYRCSPYFSSNDLKTTAKNLLSAFDSFPDSGCAPLVRSLTVAYDDVTPTSYTLRVLFGTLLKNAVMRPLIPVLVYRMARCDSNDIDVIIRFFQSWKSLPMVSQADLYQSNLLYYLIVFSELWETPEVPYKTMLERFTNSTMSDGVFTVVDTYCAFSKENASACAERNLDSFTASPIIYAKDKYWNTAAEIPNQASVLIMNGKLDPQTPYKYATYLLNALEGDTKEIITFDYATHGTLWSTPLYSGSTCGMDILASYVKNGGDLSLIDKSCMAEANTFSFKVDSRYSSYFLGTYDPYEGVYDETMYGSLSGSSDGSTSTTGTSTYKTAFITSAVLFALVLIAFGWHCIKTKRARQQNPAKMGNPAAVDISTTTEEYRAIA